MALGKGGMIDPEQVQAQLREKDKMIKSLEGIVEEFRKLNDEKHVQIEVMHKEMLQLQNSNASMKETIKTLAKML